MIMKSKTTHEKIFEFYDELRKSLIGRLVDAEDYLYPETEDCRIRGVFTEVPDDDILMKICEYSIEKGDTDYDGNWSAAQLYDFLKKETVRVERANSYYFSTSFGGLQPILALLSFLALYSEIQMLHVTFTRDKWESRGDYRSAKRVGIQLKKDNLIIGKFGDDDDDDGKAPSVIGRGIDDIHIGDTYSFGSYVQNSLDPENKEAIEWIVLDKKKTSVLLISKQGLECQPYYTSDQDATWEHSDLRKWLNDTFFRVAFSAEEQALILDTTVKAHKNPKYKIDPGNITTDRVFLLSTTEAKKYFKSNEQRKCVPTEYAMMQIEKISGRYYSAGEDTCLWWLRTPGMLQKTASYVLYGGSISDIGPTAKVPVVCVRPAFWMKIES